jgi:hypothetical protein
MSEPERANGIEYVLRSQLAEAECRAERAEALLRQVREMIAPLASDSGCLVPPAEAVAIRDLIDSSGVDLTAQPTQKAQTMPVGDGVTDTAAWQARYDR